jgi:hypothetical protein
VSRSLKQIISLYRERKSELGPQRAIQMAVSEIYEGKYQVGLPELEESKSPGIANWMTQGIDQLGMRVASVTPGIQCHAVKLGFKGSEENARTRRRALTAWWQENAMDVQLSKRARWLIAYASAPVIIRPDQDRHIPCWEERDPLGTYPAPMRASEMCPQDCIFAYERRLAWLQSEYPTAARALDPSRKASPDRTYEILEYIDGDEHVLIAMGNAQPARARPFDMMTDRAAPAAPYIELSRFPNLLGRCTVVIPQRLALNGPRGHFDQLPPLYKMQAKLMALWQVATERAIFPDTWFISRQNETVTIMQEPDGRAGVVGQVKGGDLKEMAAVAAPQVAQIIQMLERNLMTTSSIPGDFGGEPSSNVRTGRAMESSLSATIDQWLGEAQKIFGYSLRQENRIAIKMAKEYWGDEAKSFYVSFSKVNGDATYTPNKDFDTDENVVTWPFAGVDSQQLIIGIGQRLGLGEMSKKSARMLDPFIDDPDLEEDRVMSESMDQMMLQSLGQSVMQGQIGPLEMGMIAAAVKEERLDIYQAINMVHQRIQQQAMAAQQAQQQQMAMAGAGGQAGGAPPGGAPPAGLMNPNVAAQLGLPAGGTPPGGGVPSPAPSVDHMAQLMSALRPRSMTPPGGGGAAQ